MRKKIFYWLVGCMALFLAIIFAVNVIFLDDPDHYVKPSRNENLYTFSSVSEAVENLGDDLLLEEMLPDTEERSVEFNLEVEESGSVQDRDTWKGIYITVHYGREMQEAYANDYQVTILFDPDEFPKSEDVFEESELTKYKGVSLEYSDGMNGEQYLFTVTFIYNERHYLIYGSSCDNHNIMWDILEHIPGE